MKKTSQLYWGIGITALVGAVVAVSNVTGLSSSNALDLRQSAALADPEDASISLHTSGIKKAIAGDYHHAITDYNRALELSPDNSEIYYNRAVAYYSIGKAHLALEDLNRVIELQPTMAEAYANRGAILLERGDRVNALADAQTASQLFEAQGQLQLAIDIQNQFQIPFD